MTRAYAFGDTPRASARLDVLAQVFAPSSVALLRELSVPPGGLVLDLGCGPGHTTAMLAGAFPSARVVGLDSSVAFASEAARSRRAGPFVVADVARAPLPVAPADLVYARFLCVHLARPRARVLSWGGQLRTGGVVAVEEPERIDTEDPTFRRYLELAAAVVADRGGDLYAGRQLGGLEAPPELVRVVDRGVPLDVATGAAASIFALNLATWRHDDALASVARAGETEALLDQLEARRPDPTAGIIRWHMRQVALRRAPVPER